ncbi:MAG TPA: hypothetical protein VF898_01990, partial [Chloroflexota bacterium]
MESQTQLKNPVDILTLVVLSASAYMLAVALHELLGHGLACFMVHGQVLELGAFYVNCGFNGLSDLAIRWVVFAGPLVSLLIGVVAFILLPNVPASRPQLQYFIWLLGALGLMTFTGYILFSGVSGLGDFGTSREGLIYGASPEWLWRVLETLVEVATYYGVVRFSAHEMDSIIGGSGREPVRRAQRIAMIAYFSGAVVSLLIGLLNPLGIVLLLSSAVAASLGGTSGLLWMMQLLNRKREDATPPFQLARSWTWITAGLLGLAIYA